MTEKTGNVLLDTTRYTGCDEDKDTYTLEELLEIAKTGDASSFDGIVAERKSWPVMYHFSGIRGNVISWYPGIKGKRVLEIGSECGAITSIMAEMAERVTCVDVSKRKSLVNAWRMREHKNVEIHVGAFAEVERDLASDYDVITLIGLSGREARELLRAAAGHLAPGGEVIAAVRNRMGMKYFAGCVDDDTGKYFDGIEGYAGGSGAEAFSKKELEELCRASGFRNIDFYYPYPDYRFPMAVYSDAWLPKTGELGSNIVNFDTKRFVLFDEAKAYDSLVKTDLFPLFSNSFLVVLRKEDAGGEKKKERVLFSKFSNERAESLSIRTDIVESGGERYVRKAPCSGEASAHTGELEDRYRALLDLYRGTRFAPNRMRTEGGAAVFEYLTGETLEEILDRKYAESYEAFAGEFFCFLSEIDKTADCVFTQTDVFRSVFGDADGIEGAAASHVGNIDMVAANIMPASEDEWDVIDYEWTFLFPVPVNFIKWRAVHYYIEGNTKRFGLKNAGLFEAAGITAAEEELFASMEAHFQDYITRGHVPLRELYADISDGAMDLAQILKSVDGFYGKRERAKIYIDRGDGFDEQDVSEFIYMKGGVLSVRQPLEGARAVRICPAPYAGCLTVEEIGTELGPIDIDAIYADGTRMDTRRWLFDTDEPYITVNKWPKDSRYLYALLRMEYLDARSAGFLRRELDIRDRKINALMQADRRKEDLLTWRGEVIRQLMKAKPMKAYRKLRVAAKKVDPYSMLRPLLPSDPQGILYCIDHAAHRKSAYFLRGWCFDREFSEEKVYVVNSKDVMVSVSVTRYRRPDVTKPYELPEEREVGFSIEIPYDVITDPPLYLEVENARGYTCELLPIEMDPAKREEVNRKLREHEKSDHTIKNYDDWAEEHKPGAEELRRQREEKDDPALKFSVVVPLYRTDPELLKALVSSVLTQTYGNFELILSDGSGEDTPLKGLLETFSKKDSRIKIVQNKKRLRISDNTNAGLERAQGDWIVFADHDDLLTPDALYEVAREIHACPEAEFIYSDEDKYLPGDIPGEPNFKPDFSPDFLTSVNYICHLVAVKRELLERTGMLNSEYDGAQDYDFVLRCTEHTGKIRHIPKVLYHWRWTESSTAADPKAKEYAFTAGARAVRDHLERQGIEADVTGGIHAGTYMVREKIVGEPLISVIVPNKDHMDDLMRAVCSVNEKSTYRNLEFIIVENNSEEEETWAGYETLTAKYANVKVIKYEGAFNYSAINNLGVKHAGGDYLLFLNNDTEIIAADSIRNMLGVCQRDDVGAVGARLYFEDGTIQHAGVVLGYGGIAGHAFREFGADEAGYQNRILLRQDVSAVTAACMLVKRSVFEEIGGFCEELAVAFNDIDLCMKITAAGKYVVYEPGAEFYHYESKSRGYEDTPERQARFMNEVRVFKERWGKELSAGDPYYNPNLTLERPDFTLR